MTTIIALVLACGISASACMGQSRAYDGPFIVGTTPKDVLHEVSGMAQSAEPSVVWMINDSGDEPFIYAVHVRKGLQSKHRLQGAANVDWEDLAIAGNIVYVADIGDNGAKRKNVVVYRFSEPPVGNNSVIDSAGVERFELTYPDGPRDAETMLVDPITREIVVVTKRDAKARIYSCGELTSSPVQLTFRGELPFTLITSGSVSSDGRRILLKNYHKAWEWQHSQSEPLWKSLLRDGKRVPYGPELQGEAICFDTGDQGYYTTSEREDGGDAAPIFYYPAVSATANATSRDIKMPQLDVSPIDGKTGMYRLRYSIPEIARVQILLYNEGMFKMMTIADDSAESGVQERELDLRKFPSGSYAILLKTPHAQASCLLEHVSR